MDAWKGVGGGGGVACRRNSREVYHFGYGSVVWCDNTVVVVLHCSPCHKGVWRSVGVTPRLSALVLVSLTLLLHCN